LLRITRGTCQYPHYQMRWHRHGKIQADISNICRKARSSSHQQLRSTKKGMG
jgi:hypothetical protein